MSRLRQPARRFELTLDDYRLLADFRYLLRQFFVFSERETKAAGLTVQQHRALLAIKAFDGNPSIGDLADRLVIRHNSAVGLVDRLVQAGLITRNADRADRRRMTLAVTARGENKLLAISGTNRQELRRLAPLLATLVARLEQ
jgi:DNA-binding MarR family transcriptional regulator